jgi:UDP-2-acetamido-3-amino-2,3-dideoxy-glucuronate N-acetyltransferase
VSYFVHSSAIVDEGARIGSETKIWHFSHVMSGAQIGQACSLGQTAGH